MTDETRTDTVEDMAAQPPEPDDTQPEAQDPEVTEESDGDDDYQGNDPKVARAFKDAKRYRLQLRDTEAERDQLRTTIDSYHRAEAERIASAQLADPQDLWRDGAAITDLLGEDGRIDTDHVKQLVRGVLDAHPHWRKNSTKRVDSKDLKSGTTHGAEKPALGWSEALRANSN